MAGTRASAGVTRSQSGPSSTVAPTLRKLGGHRREAVGFLHPPDADTGQRAWARRRTSAVIASVIAASGMARQSMVPPRKRAAAARLDPVGAHAHVGALARQDVGEAHVALDRVAAHAGDPHRPAAEESGGKEVGRRRRRRPRPRACPGSRSRSPAGTTKVSSGACTSTPKRRIRLRVISTYGREMSGVDHRDRRRRFAAPRQRQGLQQPVRNWLDTSPRMRTGAAGRPPARRSRSGGNPSAPR